jgi:uncharacterized membrane protein
VLRNAVLFLAALLLSLTAGRAFWVWLGENPFDMAGSTYVEFFQQLDQRIAIPIAITGIGGTLFAGIAAAMFRRQRRVFHMLLAAFALALAASVVTALVNVPINMQVATWDPEALPSGYEELLRRWWQWHHVRLVGMFTAACLVYVAMLSVGTRHSPSNNRYMDSSRRSTRTPHRDDD